MIWKRLLLLVLLSFSLSLFLFSEVVLTDEEYQTVMTALTTSETELKNSEILIQNLNETITHSETIITLNEKLVTTSESLTETQSMELELLKTSLNEQRKDNFLSGLEKFIWGFCTAVLVGFGVGLFN